LPLVSKDVAKFFKDEGGHYDYFLRVDEVLDRSDFSSHKAWPKHDTNVFEAHLIGILLGYNFFHEEREENHECLSANIGERLNGLDD
jgi:hypothetical protein